MLHVNTTDPELRCIKLDRAIHTYREFVFQLNHLLPLSANVDMILFLLNLKKCMRTRIRQESIDMEPLIAWSTQFNLSIKLMKTGFLYIASDKKLMDELIEIDLSLESHEKSLGILLGYPNCCCDKISQVGENGIDDFEVWLVTQLFKTPFQLINPLKYRQGKAFISHVPCSTICIESLKIAQNVAQFVFTNREEKVLQPWLEELIPLCGLYTNNMKNWFFDQEMNYAKNLFF